ncbi:polysaccharide biosynthesis/export family protein [Adhaeribacter aquaticus]|uniref:polysaccharide biosynthesis/export family protein n=1 Tax=Adhaeribacter aquaticus TaxID=299567 RepID=UPI0006857BC6|nr:polysaccharide biosynthesis/export family protein [Adhaeribacter aquaticus]
MFQSTNSVNVDRLKKSLVNVEQNYIIQPNDYLEVRVYTNKGERIFDPNGELPFGAPGGGVGGGNNSTSRGSTVVRGGIGGSGRGGNAGNQNVANNEFLVQYDGTVRLPMINDVKLSGYTLLQADSVLQTLYSEYYIDPFVTTRVSNNRVFVLGAIGGGGGGQIGGMMGGSFGSSASLGMVIQMNDDNMNLLEVLALAGGISGTGKSYNIKIIRDYMNHDPIVQVVDLSTIDGMKRANLNIEPNDVIYVEPNPRVFLTAFRDIAPVVSTMFGVVGTIVTTILVFNNLGQN